jgi:hypothetical protein
VEEMMEKPLCLGTSEHSDTSLICKRCAFENECYLALNKKKNKKGNDEQDKP